MSEFYSQAGQDRWVVEYFNHKRGGWFLDVGANDGIHISNSYYLETVLGWDGVCVEADPSIFSMLERNRKCRCVNALVSDSSENLSFLQDGLSGRVCNGGNVSILSRTLRDILRDAGAPRVIDYMSLDIEGFESKALAGFPFDHHDVVVMTVEHNLYCGSSDNKDAIKSILLANGYVIHQENVVHDGCMFEDWFVNARYA